MRVFVHPPNRNGNLVHERAIMRVSLRLTLFFAVLGLAVPAAQAGLLVSVDFGISGSPLFTGSDSVAAASDSIFSSANIWNQVIVPGNAGPSAINPSCSGLVDNTGSATSVGLAFTGPVRGFSTSSSDALLRDYIFVNGGYNPANSLNWEITGLTPGATYAFFVYGSDRNNAAWTISVDTTGAGGFVGQVVSGNSGTAYYSTVIAGGSGSIAGIMGVNPGTEGNWSGFQLAEAAPPVSVPEPGSLTLAGLGAIGMAVGAWRRRQQPTA